MARLIAELGNGTTPPPLSQCWVDTAGRWHLLASGRANHAGIGDGWGRIRANNGNADAIGIETDHTVGEAWPPALLTSLRRGTAVLLRHLGASAGDALAGHKEYAPARKIDPAGLNMAAERRAVAAINPEEDDMSWLTERASDPGGGKWGWHILHASKMTDILKGQISALSTAVAADKDIDPAELQQMLDAAVEKATPTAAETAAALLPLVEDIAARVMGADNQALAAEFLRQLREALPIEGN